MALLVLSCNIGQDDDFRLFYQNFQEIMEKEPMMQALAEERLFLDSFLVVPKEGDIQHILTIAKEQLDRLHAFDRTRLNPDLHQHHKNLHDFLDLIIDKIVVKKMHKTIPSFYSVLPYLEFLNHENNIEKTVKGLEQVNVLFQTAIYNLDPVDTEKLQGAISESIAAFEFLSNEMRVHINELDTGMEEKKEVILKLTRTKLAAKNYIAFCNSKLFDLKDEK